MFRKYISLASSRIKHYAFHNVLIFAMFMFGITISAIAFIFFYGNSMVDKQNEARNALPYRTFIIHSTNQLNQEILKKLSNLSTSVLDVRVKCEIENPFISHVHEAMTPQPLNIISLVKNNNAIYSYQGKIVSQKKNYIRMLPLFLWTTVRFLPSYSREINLL